MISLEAHAQQFQQRSLNTLQSPFYEHDIKDATMLHACSS